MNKWVVLIREINTCSFLVLNISKAKFAVNLTIINRLVSVCGIEHTWAALFLRIWDNLHKHLTEGSKQFIANTKEWDRQGLDSCESKLFCGNLLLQNEDFYANLYARMFIRFIRSEAGWPAQGGHYKPPQCHIHDQRNNKRPKRSSSQNYYAENPETGPDKLLRIYSNWELERTQKMI